MSQSVPTTPMEDGGYRPIPTSASEYGLTPDIASLSPEERAKLEESWRAELAKTEKDIATFRELLAMKVKHANELKRKLGVTPWQEFTTDLNKGIHGFAEMPAVQKSTEAVKDVAGKTATAFSGFGSAMSNKLSNLKGSAAFKSMEEKVSGAYGAVRDKVGASRSPSAYTFDEALAEADEAAKSNGSDGKGDAKPTEKAVEATAGQKA